MGRDMLSDGGYSSDQQQSGDGGNQPVILLPDKPQCLKKVLIHQFQERPVSIICRNQPAQALGLYGVKVGQIRLQNRHGGIIQHTEIRQSCGKF